MLCDSLSSCCTLHLLTNIMDALLDFQDNDAFYARISAFLFSFLPSFFAQ